MKKIANMFADGDGAYTKGCSSKEEALEAFKGMFVDELMDDPGISLDDIKEDRYYKHRNCDGDSIGDGGDCYFCGEPHHSAGRRTFTISL